jgi:hypothetical protein
MVPKMVLLLFAPQARASEGRGKGAIFWTCLASSMRAVPSTICSFRSAARPPQLRPLSDSKRLRIFSANRTRGGLSGVARLATGRPGPALQSIDLDQIPISRMSVWCSGPACPPWRKSAISSFVAFPPEETLASCKTQTPPSSSWQSHQLSPFSLW